MRKLIILPGKKYNRLTIISEISQRNARRIFFCRCDCGNEGIYELIKLTTGNTKSCGCLKRDSGVKYATKHGLADSHIYRCYNSMKARCLNPKNKSFKHYGGRGIIICDEWLDSFDNFSQWAFENGYSEGLTIERDNVNGNYEPNNCKWIPTSEQNGNKRNSRWVVIDGEKMTTTTAAKIFNIPPVAITNRLNYGMSDHDAVKRPYTRKQKPENFLITDKSIP